MVYREVGPRIALQVSRRCSPTFALRSCSEAMVDSGGKSTELRADWLGACAWLCRFPGCDLGQASVSSLPQISRILKEGWPNCFLKSPLSERA